MAAECVPVTCSPNIKQFLRFHWLLLTKGLKGFPTKGDSSDTTMLHSYQGQLFSSWVINALN